MGLETSYGVDKDRKIYGNCQVVWKDILMFRCERKRADWYLKTLDKKTGEPIGELISEDPYTVRLKFKPKGLGNHNKEFGLTEMDNKCVCCGSSEFLTRHHVVPYCYRRFFPLELKSHNFHDVLALCVTCHEKYERNADKLKEDLAIEYNAPINGDTIKNKDVIKYRKIATTLLKDTPIPKRRLKELKKTIRNGFGLKKLTKPKLEDIASMETIIVKKTHGEIVMDNVSDIQKFVEMWRNHFINNNDCKFLPKNWSITNKLEKRYE